MSPRRARLQARLCEAAARSPASAAREILEAGADPNLPDAQGELPLYCAARNRPEVVRLLLRAGARVDGRNSNTAQAIHFAACWGKAQVARILLRHGADPNSLEEEHLTPLYWAAKGGRLTTARALLEAGADPNLRIGGTTPLMLAADYGCADLVSALLRAGADPTARDSEGCTARDRAQRWCPDLRAAALAMICERHPDQRVQWRWRPRKTRDRRLVVRVDALEWEWTDGHGRIVDILGGG